MFGEIARQLANRTPIKPITASADDAPQKISMLGWLDSVSLTVAKNILAPQSASGAEKTESDAVVNTVICAHGPYCKCMLLLSLCAQADMLAHEKLQNFQKKLFEIEAVITNPESGKDYTQEQWDNIDKEFETWMDLFYVGVAP